MSGDSEFVAIYRALRRAFGHQHWWPAQTPFEVVVGAVLTQNTNWKNVEKAIENLRRRGLLNARRLSEAPPAEVQDCVTPAGYYRQKAARLVSVARWVREAGAADDNELGVLARWPCDLLRSELLRLSGIGPETADSILLYALGKPVFVVDAYTVRIMGRHGFVEPGSSYADVQEMFHERLPADVELYKDFHAQFVELGKRYCRKRAPKCPDCPLRDLLGAPVETGG